jgi:hypothetical protein
MPIVAADIATRYSGGAGNASASASLGGVMSSTAFADNDPNNLWDDVTGAESSAGDVEHRAFYVRNGHATLAWQSVFYWIDALTTSTSTEFDIALASEAVNTAIAQTLAGEGSVPSGVTFTRPTSKATGLSIGNIPATQFKGLWIRRTVTAGAAAIADTGSIRLEGDTAA